MKRLVILAALAGCATPTLPRGAVWPEVVDSPATWVYLDTKDPARAGIWRCHDMGQRVVCKRAELVP